MGGRGTFAAGKSVTYTYKTVGTIEGVKVLEKINKNDSAGLPEESHSSNAYILLRKDGTFKMYREYNSDHTANFDIDLHPEPLLSGNREPVYHIHFYKNGVRDPQGRFLTVSEYNKFKSILGGKK